MRRRRFRDWLAGLAFVADLQRRAARNATWVRQAHVDPLRVVRDAGATDAR